MGLKTVTALLLMTSPVAVADTTGDYIALLDETVDDFQHFHLKKEAEIDSLKAVLKNTGDDERKY